MTGGFTLDAAPIALPPGASAATHRRVLRLDGRPVLGLTQGRRRAYIHPLFSPEGFALTAESPADHPHHNGLWIAADHVAGLMPTGAGAVERYDYNFYVDETFQGRAPGRIVETGCDVARPAPDRIVITQRLDWRGPAEWGAPEGRLALREARRIAVTAQPGRYVLDVASRVAANGWDVEIGPTRHAWLTLRVAESIALAPAIALDTGAGGGAGGGARWAHASGPVGGGRSAGVAVFPDPRDHAALDWFVADWGVVTAQPFLRAPLRLRVGGPPAVLRYRVVAHDGPCDIAAAYAAFAGDDAPPAFDA